jgi:MFS family permease
MGAQSAVSIEENGIKWGPIRLLAGVKSRNMTVYLLGSIFTMLFSTFVPQAQPFILTEILRIPAEQQGQLSGYLGLAQTIVSLIMPGIAGTISDKTGRRLVYAVGFLLSAVGVFLYPLAGTLVALFAFRMIFSAGSNASNTMNNALLGDYIDKSDRGKAYGMIAAAGGIGALTTVFVFMRLPAMFQDMNFTPVMAGRYTFWIVAGLGLVAMLIVGAGLRGKTQRQADEKRNALQIARYALQAAGADPVISLAYGVNFVGSGVVTALGTYLTLWMVNYGTTQAGMTSAAALARAGMIIGISQIMGLVAAPVFGVLSDKMGGSRAVVLSTGLTAVVFAATLLIANPLSGLMIVMGLFLGFVQISSVITGGALIGKQAPEAVRGSVMGFYGFCGALGIMLTFLLGGWLFDHWLYQGPFVLLAVVSACVAVWGIVVNQKMGREEV